MSKAKRLDDPFAAIIHHLDDAGSHVREVYELDKRGALYDPKDAQTAQLVKTQLAKAAALLRDLAYTGWVDSAKPRATEGPERNPISPSNPKLNQKDGFRFPDGPAVPYRPDRDVRLFRQQRHSSGKSQHRAARNGSGQTHRIATISGQTPLDDRRAGLPGSGTRRAI